jgi:hypothetical protein
MRSRTQYGGWSRVALAMIVTEITVGTACSQSAREPATAPTEFPSRQTRVPGEYVVTLAAGADVKAISDLYGRFGIKGTRDLGQDLFLVTLIDDPGPARLEELRGRSAQIKAIQPNFVYRSSISGKAQ